MANHTAHDDRRDIARRRVQPISGRRGKGVAERQERLDFGVLPSLIGFHLRLAQVAVFRDFLETMGSLDVTPGLFAVLVLIEANPGLKQTALAQAVRLDRSTVVSVVDKLERRRLVQRRTSTRDRRSNALFLTAAGASLLGRLKARVAAHEKRLVRGMQIAERRTLVALLDRVFPEQG